MEKEWYNHIVILNQPPRYWAQIAAYITKWETSTDDVPLTEEYITAYEVIAKKNLNMNINQVSIYTNNLQEIQRIRNKLYGIWHIPYGNQYNTYGKLSK